MVVVVCVFLAVVAGQAGGTTYYVDANGFADFTTIQGAISDAGTVNGDEIEVAPGTYYEAIDFSGKGVRLYSSGGPDVTTINGTGNYHVVKCVNGEGAGTILEGFTITGGNANGGPWPDYHGGGMLNDTTSPTVTNCIFSGNQASQGGGGMLNNWSNPTVTGCNFSGNTAGQIGGGMYNYQSSPTVTNCIFSSNDAANGGGGVINNVSSSPVVTNCTFSDNTALDATYGDGGGMWNSTNSDANVTDCNFSGNIAGHDGGGMFNTSSGPTVINCTFSANQAGVGGGGMINFSGSSATVTDCNFSGNTAGNDGGGMYNYSSSPTVTTCTFISNQADNAGGGMLNYSGSSPTVAYCAFTDNEALDSTYGDGGGMWNGSNSDANVTDCNFSGNIAGDSGGGMYNYQSSPTVTNSEFISNQADNGGGGMYNYDSSSPTVTNCIFRSNSGDYGGGMFNDYSSSPTLTSCTFNGNSATDSTTGFGGGMYNLTNSSPKVTNCTFSGNSAGRNGGGMDNRAGSDPNVTDCNFSGNTARFGGGMENYASSPTVTDCNFSGNTADMDGGGMYNLTNSSPAVTNCTFSGNSAEFNEGGGMYNYDSSSPTVTDCNFSGNTARFGGGMYNLTNSSPTVTNCIFRSNSADFGGGMYNLTNSSPTVTNCTFSGNDSGIGNYTSNPTVTNCILWGNTSYEMRDSVGSASTVNYCDVNGGWGSGTGNIDADPCFVDAAGGNLRLAEGSPCIDAGDNNGLPGTIVTDLAGNARYADDPYTIDTGDGGMTGPPIIDMGAYEFISTWPAPQDITVENPSFEEPPGGKQEYVEPNGWSVDGNEYGIEASSCEGLQSLYLGDNNSAYQLTDHTIAAGDVYILRFEAFKTWPESGTATYEGWLYYEQGLNLIEIASVAGSDVDRDCNEYELMYAVGPGDAFIGKKLGILFVHDTNIGGGIWVGFDNVRLSAGNPLLSGSPYPSDGSKNVIHDVVLGWTGGVDANAHDVYLGADSGSVSDANTNSGEYMGRQQDSNSYDVNGYDPCGLEFSTTYYWRIDGVNGPSTKPGGVWSFTVRDAGDFTCDGVADVNDLKALADDWLNSGYGIIIAEAYKDNQVNFKDYAILADTWHWGRYFVDSNDGNDNNSGTSPGEAWKSLTPVNSMTFVPGDEILFRAGTSYTGQLKPQGSGAQGKPIIIDMYGDGNKPRIDGEGLVLDTLLLENVEYYEVNNLEITNLGPTRENWRTGVKVFANSCGTLHDIKLRNLYVHDVNGSLDKSTEGCGIYWYCAGSTPSRFDGLLVEDCHVVRTDRNGICGRSTFTRRASNWYPSLNVVIRGNLLEDIGGDCIKPWGCEGCLVEYNVVHYGRQRCDPNNYAAGIWPWSCDNTVIQFNEVSHMKGTKDGQGFDSDYNCYYTTIQYNYSHDNDGGFLLVCGPTPDADFHGTTKTVVRYNISENDGLNSTQVCRISGGGPQDTYIYNNTIYVGADQNLPLIEMGNWGGWADNTRFYNNIFYVDVGGQVTYSFGGSTNNVFKNNVFYGNHVSPPADPNAITSDPMLVDPNSGGDGIDTLDGYMLQAGSPCIWAGTDTGIDYNDPNYLNGGMDFWGNALPDVNDLDIGAHQYSN
jgi:parallel beta-helix repeat protein